MTTYSLRAIKVAEVSAPGPHVCYQSHWDEWFPFAFYVWVLSDGRETIVIDTGMPQGEYLERLQKLVGAIHPRLPQYENVRPVSEALAEAGVQPEEVDHLLITTVVVHTTGGIENFRNARIYMSKRGWMDYWVPEFPHPFPRDIFFTPPALKWLVTEAWERVHLVGEDEEILPGIRMFWAGVHHRGSMCVSIETSKGTVTLFEPAFLYINVEQKIPIGVLESIAEWHEIYGKVERIGGIILPSHDPALLERYPEGIIA